MKGGVSFYNSPSDIRHGLEVDPEGTKADLRAMIERSHMWTDSAVIADGDPGITDETHRVQVMPANDMDPWGPMRRVQQEWLPDPASDLVRLGLTEGDAWGIIGGKALPA